MKILIAEDDPVSRRMLQDNLIEWGYDVTVAADGREAIEAIQHTDPPSLIISDWMMPHVDGLMLCREIRNQDITHYIYVILLTTNGENENITKGLEAGADDILAKPFNQEEIRSRILIGERIIKLAHRILQVANTDPLTGVMNRRAFMERMTQEIERAHRGQSQFSFILTDIDHFKLVNDTHGHQVGDLVLQCFSKTLKMVLRPYDFLGRYGGEEFMVCMPGADEDQAESAAERLRKEVEEMEVILPGNAGLYRITSSFGTATCTRYSIEGMESLIKRADDALYRAKGEGRNRVIRAVSCESKITR